MDKIKIYFALIGGLLAVAAIIVAADFSYAQAPPVVGVCRIGCEEAPPCPANSSYNSSWQCICNPGYWLLDGVCVPADDWCRATYGHSHEENGECPCDVGYSTLNGRCIDSDEWCNAAYGGNAYESNGQCFCVSGYWVLNGESCVTFDEWCNATYGGGSREENGSCVSASQQTQSQPQGQFSQPQSLPSEQSQPSTQPKPQVIIEIQKSKTSPVKKPSQPAKKTTPSKKVSPRKEMTNKEMQAVAQFWFGAIGYDSDDMNGAMEAAGDMLAAAMGYPNRKVLKERAKTKRDAADKEFVEAARDGTIKDPATREKIRKMYLDSWLDNPQDKKTDMMMAVFEKENGNLNTADVFEKFAYMNLSQKERNTLAAAVNKAKEGMGEKLMGEEVNRTLLKTQLEGSSFMNQLRQNVNGEIAKAKETTKDACYGNSVCDWVWAKKVGVITEAQKLSQNVSDLMNDPVKTIFGVDRKKIREELIYAK